MTKLLRMERETTLLLPIVFLILTFMCLNACATAQVKFGAIPAPPPTNKLRVFILPVSGSAPGGMDKLWGRPHEEWKKSVIRGFTQSLQSTGIYEVVSEKEVEAVLGAQKFTDWQWQREDLSLLKRVGKALHTDYVFMTSRIGGANPWFYESRQACVNIESGRLFTHSFYTTYKAGLSYQEQIAYGESQFGENYRALFSRVKEDLLATALRKGSLWPTEAAPLPVLPPPQPASATKPESPSAGPLPKVLREPKVPDSSLALPPRNAATADPPGGKGDDTLGVGVQRQTAPTGAWQATEPGRTLGALAGTNRPEESNKGRKRLVVYDFEAAEQLRVVSMILTEALREELFLLGRHTLITRENSLQVMEEYKLQQSGMVDEKQIAELGKWLAASESVTGRFAQMGGTYILQAKITDVTTLETLGVGSLRALQGNEGELLARMPDLARRLVDRHLDAPKGR
jgi:hypothetical protein